VGAVLRAAADRLIAGVAGAGRIDLVLCGSYRRGKAFCGDIDILLTSHDPGYTPRQSERLGEADIRGKGGGLLLEQLVEELSTVGLLTDHLTLSSQKQHYGKDAERISDGLENET
jgi:DNA polymerase/3'-5' exonuclease PolX